MRDTIYKTVVLPASSGDLYDMYMDSKIHSQITGAPAKIHDESGTAFEALGGLIRGMTLQVVKHRLIVQSWRTVNFDKSDRDSILIIAFEPEDDDGRIDLVHLDVPKKEFQGIAGGWESRYFSPWLEYLQSRDKG